MPHKHPSKEGVEDCGVSLVSNAGITGRPFLTWESGVRKETVFFSVLNQNPCSNKSKLDCQSEG